MTIIKTNADETTVGKPGSSPFMPVMRGAFGLRLPQPVFAPEGDDVGGDSKGITAEKIAAAAAATEKAAADKAAAEKDKATGNADKSAEILAAAEAARREVEAKLREFGDATPAELKELRELKKKADDAAKKAGEDAKKADEEKLRAAGDFEALKARMADEHKREMEAIDVAKKELESTVGALNTQISNMALNTSFAASRFIAEETVLTPTMARKVFSDHFEVEAGAVVGYDAPQGSEKRTKLVDARGNPLPFDEAMKRIVEVSTDRDMILKAKQKPGSGFKPSGDKAPPAAKAEVTGLARIKMGMASLRPLT